ncbi:MAG: phosphatase [Oscillospiraceae bacterium]|nr:phosphatase [Oscillospiraceae bacterium]
MIDVSKLTAEERTAIEARRAYKRAWRAANKDRVKEYEQRFYTKRAAELTADRKNTAQ